jgi:hypothetical protein
LFPNQSIGFVLRVLSSVYQNYTVTKRVVYLNICHHAEVAPITLQHSHSHSPHDYYHIPHVVHLSYNSSEYKIYDIVFASKSLNESRRDEIKRRLLITAALQIVTEQYAEKFDQEYEILSDVTMKNPPQTTDVTLITRNERVQRTNAALIASQKQNAELQQILCQITQITILPLTVATASLFDSEEYQQISAALCTIWPTSLYRPETAHIPFVNVKCPMRSLPNGRQIPSLSFAQTAATISVVAQTDQITTDWHLQFCIETPLDTSLSRNLEAKGRTENGVYFVFRLQLVDYIEVTNSFATLTERNLVIVLKKKEPKFWLCIFDK